MGETLCRRFLSYVQLFFSVILTLLLFCVFHVLLIMFLTC